MGSGRSNRSALWRLPVDREVREEMELHLELLVREHEQQGLSSEEARWRARERFGDPARWAAECRQLARERNRRWSLGDALSELDQDLRFALRQLRLRPVFALTVIVLLALGLGATTAVAGLLYQALWQPPPFAEPERLVTLWEQQLARGAEKNVVGPANFIAWREETTAFSGIAGLFTGAANLAGEGEPQRVKARYVTVGYFDVLGVPPLLGRLFVPEDTAGEGRSVVVLAHHLWQQRFGGRRDVVGSSLQLDGRDFEIVGVARPEVKLAMGLPFAPYGDAPDLYQPLPIREEWRQAGGRWMMVIARLRPAVTLAQAQAELDAVMARQTERNPGLDAGWTARVLPLAEHLREPLRLPLLALLGAVTLMLLIVCVNVSSLMVGRNLARSGELAVRRALGAGRARLSRQLLVEGAVLALAAGLGGWLLAGAIHTLARTQLPPALAPAAEGAAPPELWLVALGLGGVCLLFFGWLPALPALRPLRALAHPAALGGGHGRHRLRAGLMFFQLATALVLLVGAGLMLRTVWGLLERDPGFDGQGAVSFAVAPARSFEETQVAAFYDQLLERLEALPGVSKVGAISHLPMASAGAATRYSPADRPPPEPGEEAVADIRIVRGDLLEALGIPLLEGRTFDERDRFEQQPKSALISRRLAETWWPGRSALGREIRVSWGDDDPRVVVGVVGEVANRGLDVPARETIYFPHAQESSNVMTIVLRSDRGLEVLAPLVRQVVGEIDASLPVYELRTVASVLDRSVERQRFLARVLGALAGLALLLAVVGIYGLTSLVVAQSTREIGLRMALGATPAKIAGLFVRRIAWLTAAAVVAGLSIAVAAGKSVEALLYGVAASDPLTLTVTAGTLAAATLLAALVPARRAARLDPTRALRWE